MIDGVAAGLMIAICLAWALQPIGLKVTADYASPVLQIGMRYGIASVLVYIVILVKRQKVEWFSKTSGLGVFVGLVFAADNFFVGEALKYTSASHVITFLYTAPIFAGVGLHLCSPIERLSGVQWAGIGIAAGGIAYAFLLPSGAPAGLGPSASLWGDFLALLGGASWGATTVLIRATRLSSAPVTHVLFYQLASGFVVLVLIVYLGDELHIELAWPLAINIAFQSILASFLAFLVWLWLLTKYNASQLGIFSFMTPMFGVIIGYALLGEPLTPSFLVGSVAVLFGIMIVSAYPWLKRHMG